MLPRVDQAPCPATIGAYDAKTHFAALPDPVERGEEVTITRRGRPVAKLVPLTAHGVAAARTAVAELAAVRRELVGQGVRSTREERQLWALSRTPT